ncbi:hypothetical protein [Rhizobium sp. P32RR-XVIII]|uniref:hypothetical protein n=1 Tax=Rhizobium sp. P32RR-XVIII TaxID=2726738 RepID=UPI001FEF3B02|nr:hypothetical protein [Rhizobium sp. P32RR-XVIII]
MSAIEAKATAGVFGSTFRSPPLRPSISRGARKVLKGGVVVPGDAVDIRFPVPPLLPLEVV